VLDVKDGATVHANAAISQLTRIGMTDGSQLSGVFGVKGQVKITKDEEGGEAFIQPMVPTPFSIFVRDEYNAAYTLVITPVNTPGEMILLRPQRKSNMSEQAEKAMAYKELIKRTLKIVASNDDLESMDPDFKDEKAVTIPLWEEAIFRLHETRDSATIRAHIYTLVNVSDSVMRLAESEFTHVAEDWRAISLRKLVLQPGESTRVYILTDRK
jgi:hypothetical protein